LEFQEVLLSVFENKEKIVVFISLCPIKGKKNCGRKRTQIDFDGIQDIPLHKRSSSVRSTSYALNVSESTLHRALKLGVRASTMETSIFGYLDWSNVYTSSFIIF